jgi:hypothetical protein
MIMNVQKNITTITSGTIVALLIATIVTPPMNLAYGEYMANAKTVTGLKNQPMTFLISGSAPQEFFYQIRDATDNGTVTIDGATGEVSYTPNADFVGTDTFTFRTVAVQNTNWFGESALVTINILAQNPNDNGSHTSPEQNQGNNNNPGNNNGSNNNNGNSSSGGVTDLRTGGGGLNIWKVFYEPIYNELKNYTGTQIQSASEPFDYWHSGTRAYIEYSHFQELVNRQADLKLQDLTENQKAWLFLQIKPEIDESFKWLPA